MKVFYKWFGGVFMLLVAFTCLGACSLGEESGEDTQEPTQHVFLSDFAIPQNFTITFGSDAEHLATTTKVGDSWHTKTYTDEEYFYAYQAENSYMEYEKTEGVWTQTEQVNFEEMTSVLRHSNYGYNFYAILIFDEEATLQGQENLTINGTTYETDQYYKEYNVSSTFQSDTYYMHPNYENICLKYVLYVDGFTYNYQATNFADDVQSFAQQNIETPVV